MKAVRIKQIIKGDLFLRDFFRARRMVSPLSRLSTATRQVAAGDLGSEVIAGQRDEMGIEVHLCGELKIK